MIQWLRFLTSNPGGMGLIAGQGTKIPLVEWHGQKKGKRGLPWLFSGKKNLPSNAGDTSSIPDLGRSHMPYAVEHLSPRATTVQPVL